MSRLFKFFIVTLVIGVSAFLYMQRKQEVRNVSDLAMIIASNSVLADPESSSGGSGNKKVVDCYRTITTAKARSVVYCGTCSTMDGSKPVWYAILCTCKK